MRRIIRSNNFLVINLLLLLACIFIFQHLPNNIYQNMLDLSFGFKRPNVHNTFNFLGESGRANYILSSLTLDTLFPILYSLFFISIFLKLNVDRSLILCLPIIAAVCDLGENVFIASMMSYLDFNHIADSQILIGSLFNQGKWIFCFATIVLILLKLLARLWQFK